MPEKNLLTGSWTQLDLAELRILLHERIGGPGQYQDRSKSPNKFYLPLAGPKCKIKLTYRGTKIVSMHPGPAFELSEWEDITKEMEATVLTGDSRTGREFSFNIFRVSGSWRGVQSGVQILPPPDGTPRADIESADHPFILEFPLKGSALWPITNHRRMRDHRRLTRLLNVLLAGHTSFLPLHARHFWALVDWKEDGPETKWVQHFFPVGPLVESPRDELSPPAAERLKEIPSEKYYAMRGHDGEPLRVPADLDESIRLYQNLSAENQARFDRAAFWLDMAWRHWGISFSSSFASLVSAVESLTDRGNEHRVYCEECEDERSHEVPGATERFRAFFETYAPDPGLRRRRTMMYDLRSEILHGSRLLQLDQQMAFAGWDPPEWNESELHNELWSLTRVAIRSWLVGVTSPPAAELETPGD